MHVSPGGQGREDVLRSLGAVFDAHEARGVLVMELVDGFLLRARVPAPPDGPFGVASMDLERVFRAEDIAREQEAALARRGSGHVAGPIERALRTIGRYADEYRLVDVSAWQRGDVWLLRHRLPDGTLTIVDLGGGELELLEWEAAAGRRGLAAAGV
jgi:hypothetical protein